MIDTIRAGGYACLALRIILRGEYVPGKRCSGGAFQDGYLSEVRRNVANTFSGVPCLVQEVAIAIVLPEVPGC